MLLSSVIFFFFLMIRRPPRSTLDRSSAASDVYKRQTMDTDLQFKTYELLSRESEFLRIDDIKNMAITIIDVRTNTLLAYHGNSPSQNNKSVSYTHLRAHETVLDLVCRLLLEKKKKQPNYTLFLTTES